MITKEEVRALLQSTETYRIERTTSTGDMDKRFVHLPMICLIPERKDI